MGGDQVGRGGRVQKGGLGQGRAEGGEGARVSALARMAGKGAVQKFEFF